MYFNVCAYGYAEKWILSSKQFFINLVCNNYSVFVVLQLLTVALGEFWYFARKHS